MTGVMPIVLSERRFLCVSSVQQCRRRVIGQKVSTKTEGRDTDNCRATAAVEAAVNSSLAPVRHQYGVNDDDMNLQLPPYWSRSRNQRWST